MGFHRHHGKLVILGLVVALSSCQDRGFITPPTQTVGIPSKALNTTTAEQHPRFDYQGRYLVFASDRGSTRGIFLYDLQSHQLIPLPELNQAGSFQDQPDISADGRYITYVSERAGKPDIWVYDRVSFRTENLTQNFLGLVRHPTISGNGRFVAFETNRSGQWDISIYDRGLNVELSLPQNSPQATPQEGETE